MFDEIKDKGIIVIRNWMPDVSNLMPEFDKTLARSKFDYPAGRMNRIPREHYSQIPTISTLFQQDDLRDLARLYLGKPDYLLQIFMSHEWKVLPKESWSRNQHTHFDPYHALKFMLYMTDVTADNGAFLCVPGSQNIGKELRGRNTLDKNLQSDTYTLAAHHDHANLEEKLEPIEGSAGTLLIFDTDILHCGGILKSGERKVIIAHNRRQ